MSAGAEASCYSFGMKFKLAAACLVLIETFFVVRLYTHRLTEQVFEGATDCCRGVAHCIVACPFDYKTVNHFSPYFYPSLGLLLGTVLAIALFNYLRNRRTTHKKQPNITASDDAK